MGLNMSRVGWTLFAKASFVTAVVLTYTFHTDLKKAEYNIFEKKQPVAENFYENPPILEVEWKTNDKGKIETYLVNKETGKGVKILYDMMPSNKEMIEALKKRMREGFLDKEELSDQVYWLSASNKKNEDSKYNASSNSKPENKSIEYMLEEMMKYCNEVKEND